MLALMDIGEQIAQERKLAKLTQRELANRAGVSRLTIVKLENGNLGELGVTKLANILANLRLDLQVRPANRNRPTLTDLQRELSNDKSME